MSNDVENSKRIAKNAMLLYMRTAIVMLVTLYTSRVVLGVLGVEDYGLYNVVGGVVAMFSVLSGSFSTAISRFITFELGKKDQERLRLVFSTSINALVLLVVIVLLLLETVGIWFLEEKLVVPEERLNAARWVYQFSVLTFAINLWSVPYNASVIAHERMAVFAYISLFDAGVKLLISYMIMRSPFDSLIYYALLLLLNGLLVRCLYSIYCKRHFEECRYQFRFDKKLFKEMLGFSGWNFLGASSDVFRDQGGNVLLNLFFGPAVNAARAVSMQVGMAVLAFVNNFMAAFRPQIIKNYADGNHEYMLQLIYRSSKFSFFIFWLMALPVLVTTQSLLHLWLGSEPAHSVNFVRLILLYVMHEMISAPMITAMLATGNIRNYQIVVGGIQLLNLPISYICLFWGAPSEAVFIVAVSLSFIALFFRVYMLRKMIGLSFRKFYMGIYFRIVMVIVVSSIIPFALKYNLSHDFAVFLLLCSVSFICSLLSIYVLGCTREERSIVSNGIIEIVSRIRG